MQREEVQLSQCWTFLYGVQWETRAAVPSISTQEDQLADDMQEEDEREADDDE